MKTFQFLACVALFLTVCVLGLDRVPAADEPSTKPANRSVVAIVNGDPIYQVEVDQLASKALAGRQGTAPPKLRAESLRQLVNQRVVESALTRDDLYVKKSEIDAAVKKVEAEAKAQRLNLEQFAEARGASINAMRHELAWRLGWPKYIEANLAEALEGYFKKHHKDYDGTIVKVSHILLRAEKPSETVKETIERADKVRAEIEEGKLTFEQAAEKYSSGPSRHRGGDLGFFPRTGVMVEDFSKAAFSLEKGEISQPVPTVFGVHLIRATDIKAGSRQWTEAVNQMKNPAAADLFEQLAEKETKGATIEFTGKTPYFKTGTDELVLPSEQK